LGEEALELHRTLDHQLGMGLDYTLFGDIACGQGDYTGALDQYQHCLSLWRDRENIVNSALVVDNIAQVFSRMGDPLRGTTLMGAAAAIRERSSAKLAAGEQASRDETRRACRAALGEAGFTAAWSRGRMLTLAQTVNLALEQSSVVSRQ
jgi:hypothetical protein